MAESKRVAPARVLRTSARFLIVEGRYYDEIGDLLLAGASAAFEAAGAAFDTIQVPGALEIPVAIAIAAARAVEAGRPYAGAVALGCILRGETYHFEVVANESARGLMDYGLRQGFPVGNGILTVDNEEQARVRADPRQGDKGGEAARAALMLHQIGQGGGVS